jgi:hypothetical protein
MTRRSKSASLTLVREARKREEAAPVPPNLRAYVSLEAEAVEIKTFQIDLIPSLLQTERYIRAIAVAHDPTQSHADVDQLIAIRRERQARLLADFPVFMTSSSTVASSSIGADRSKMLAEEVVSGRAERRPCTSAPVIQCPW